MGMREGLEEMAMNIPNKTEILFRNIWRKAGELGGLEIECKKGDGLRIRTGLYRAVKEVREGEVVDPGLLDIIERYAVGVGKREDGLEVVQIKLKMISELAERIAEGLGIGDEEEAGREEKERMEESLKRLQEKTEGSGDRGKGLDNPFYKRD